MNRENTSKHQNVRRPIGVRQSRSATFNVGEWQAARWRPAQWIRALVLPGVMLVAGAFANGQTVLGPNGPMNPEKAQPSRQPTGGPIVYKLTVTPAPEPDPPLKYSLYPRWDELKPGNSVPMWYRALSETWQNSPHMKPLSDNYDRWFAEPWTYMPADEVREFVRQRRYSLADAHEAAYREETEWDLRLRDLRGPDTINVQLGEFQDARTLARILSLSTRLHLLDRDFEAALEDMTVSLRLAHDVAEPETFINDLIGIAIIAMTEENIRHLIDTPGSPNLYWALAELPDPLIDLLPATHAEMTLPERIFPWLKKPGAEERSIERWHDLLYQAVRDVSAYDNTLPNADPSTVKWGLLGLTMRGYPTAKRDLIDSGYTAEDVDAMPVGKVIALHQQSVYHTLWHNFEAAMFLPYPEGQQRFAQLDHEMREQGYLSRPWHGREVIPIASALLPSLEQVQRAGTRRAAMRAALMTVEAIRMHLAESDGRLPRSLEEITVVPVPNNPQTEEPFSYHLRGNVAVLDLPLQYNHQQFEIRVAGERR